MWMEKLKKDDAVLFVKFCQEPPPENSGIDANALILVIQTAWQREQWTKYGVHYMGIDGTHNCTQYQATTLFTLIARNDWGRGVSFTCVSISVVSNNYRCTCRMDGLI